MAILSNIKINLKNDVFTFAGSGARSNSTSESLLGNAVYIPVQEPRI